MNIRDDKTSSVLPEGVEDAKGQVYLSSHADEADGTVRRIEPWEERDEIAKCKITGRAVAHRLSTHVVEQWCLRHLQDKSGGEEYSEWAIKAVHRSPLLRQILTAISLSRLARIRDENPIISVLGAERPDVWANDGETQAYLIDDIRRVMVSEIAQLHGWIVIRGRTPKTRTWTLSHSIQEVVDAQADLSPGKTLRRMAQASGNATMGRTSWPHRDEVIYWKETWPEIASAALRLAGSRFWCRHNEFKKGPPWLPCIWYQVQSGKHHGQMDLDGDPAWLFIVDEHTALGNPELSEGNYLLVWEQGDGTKKGIRIARAWWPENRGRNKT